MTWGQENRGHTQVRVWTGPDRCLAQVEYQGKWYGGIKGHIGHLTEMARCGSRGRIKIEGTDGQTAHVCGRHLNMVIDGFVGPQGDSTLSIDRQVLRDQGGPYGGYWRLLE